MQSVDILVVGAGPTGLGAAARLEQLGAKWRLIEQGPEAGGLAATDETPEGFLFDIGGHVIFSHFQFFDQLIDTAVGSGPEHWNELQRVSYVWIKNRWVPYPFQNNLYCLPLEEQISCINGVIDATKESASATERPKNFDEWIMRVMGKGIADIFMRPYNFKVWACPTEMMQCEWLGERVATVDAKKVVENVLRNQESVGWGPNATFRFPLVGGTGGIWKAVGKMLPQDKMQFGTTIVAIDAEKKVVTCKDGSKIQYNKMMSTMPLDKTLGLVGKPELGEGLVFSSTHVIGIGIRGVNPHDTKCWLYYPEDNCPFYRCTVFSLYAEKNCPGADVKLKTIQYGDGTAGSDEAKSGPYWSLMFEVSESKHKPVNHKTIIQETIKGALNTSMIKATDEIVSIHHRWEHYGYPTPSLHRDAALKKALPFLKEKSIWSRGRFGSWKYEVGNQDHSCMVGVEAVDNMIYGAQEFTLNCPNLANQTKNVDLVFEKTW